MRERQAKQNSVSEADRQSIQADYYLTRYQACENVLKENNIPKNIYQLRRIFALIMTEKDEPTAEERKNFVKVCCY